MGGEDGKFLAALKLSRMTNGRMQMIQSVEELVVTGWLVMLMKRGDKVLNAKGRNMCTENSFGFRSIDMVEKEKKWVQSIFSLLAERVLPKALSFAMKPFASKKNTLSSSLEKF